MLANYEVFTVAYMNWKGIENGALLALAARNGPGTVITKDTGIEYEQNLAELPCSVVIFDPPSNSNADYDVPVRASRRSRDSSFALTK